VKLETFPQSYKKQIATKWFR